MRNGRRIEAPEFQRSSAVIAALVAAAVAAVALGPAYVRHGARLLFAPWRSAAAATPYAIAVTPGNATVPRGGDQEIAAQLRGFDAEEVEVAVRRGAQGTWERLPMGASSAAIHQGARDSGGVRTQGTEAAAMNHGGTGAYTIRLFDLTDRTEYYVEANGVRSPVFVLTVADLPYVKRIDLEYHFPPYTGLPPQRDENGGDIAALPGTRVTVRATPTMPVAGGQIVVEGRDTIALAPDSAGALAGTLTVSRPGFYKVELQGADGRIVPGSLDYTIDVLTDQPPTVHFRKPGRDTKVTSVEEVFAEAEAQDDYGVAKLELVYSVNGGPEKRVALAGGGRRLKEVSAGHTFFLEEMQLTPGDVVSYYARATDADNVTGPKGASTDIYFMTVRPFGQDYRQAQQGGGGGGGGGDDPTTLSARQREIVAATFKTVRDRPTLAESEFRENVATITLGQGRLREEVDRLIQNLQRPGVMEADTAFKTIAEELPQAAREMRAAEEELGKRNAKDALPPEQRALQHLQRAEAAYRTVQVSFGGAGGGGSGSQSRVEDLADLFELQTDKLRNQYETVQRQRQQQQQADDQVDEALERLRRLAARQQQENERMRRLAQGPQNQAGGGSGGDSQRQLADETEEAARRLERLARERQSPELTETARRLQEAANEMRRSAAAGERGSGQGASALQRLEEARRRLEDNRTTRLDRDARDALRRAEELAAEQRRIASDVERLGQQGGGEGTPQGDRLIERKEALAQGVGDLERDLDRMSRDSRREQAEAARKLQEAANSIRDTRLADKIRYSKNFVRGNASSEYARTFEGQIGDNLDSLRSRIASAAGAVRDSASRSGTNALDRTRELVRGMESLGERMRERRESAGARAQDARADGNREPGTESRPQPGTQPGSQSANREGGAQQGGQQQGGQQQGGQRGQQGQQGREGQQGQQGQGGQQGGQQPGSRQPGGSQLSPGGAAGVPGGAPGRLSPEDVRQFGRELRDRRQAAEGLRRELARQGEETRDLEQIIARMRELESDRVFANPAEMERLQAEVVEQLKAFEFALRRRLARDDRERLLLGGSDEVPPGFRQLVEEYYKSLAKRGKEK